MPLLEQPHPPREHSRCDANQARRGCANQPRDAENAPRAANAPRRAGHRRAQSTQLLRPRFPVEAPPEASPSLSARPPSRRGRSAVAAGCDFGSAVAQPGAKDASAHTASTARGDTHTRRTTRNGALQRTSPPPASSQLVRRVSSAQIFDVLDTESGAGRRKRTPRLTDSAPGWEMPQPFGAATSPASPGASSRPEADAGGSIPCFSGNAGDLTVAAFQPVHTGVDSAASMVSRALGSRMSHSVQGFSEVSAVREPWMDPLAARVEGSAAATGHSRAPRWTSETADVEQRARNIGAVRRSCTVGQISLDVLTEQGPFVGHGATTSVLMDAGVSDRQPSVHVRNLRARAMQRRQSWLASSRSSGAAAVPASTMLEARARSSSISQQRKSDEERAVAVEAQQADAERGRWLQRSVSVVTTAVRKLTPGSGRGNAARASSRASVHPFEPPHAAAPGEDTRETAKQETTGAEVGAAVPVESQSASEKRTTEQQDAEGPDAESAGRFLASRASWEAEVVRGGGSDEAVDPGSSAHSRTACIMEPDCAVASPSALREGPELLKLPSSLRARRPSRNAPVASPGARANLFGGNLRNTLEENALSTYEEVARFLGPTTTLTRDRSSRSSAYVLSRAGSSLAGSIGGAASFNGERPRLRRSSTRSGASLLPFFGRKDSAVSAAMIHTDSGGLEADARPGTSGLRTTSRLNVGTLDGKTAGFFNHYQVIKTIGSGASGDVKLCMNLYDQTLAAVKLVAKTSRRGSLGSRPPDKAATLKREAEVLTQLCHPNIVNVHEIIDDDSAPHLLCVMDYVEGGPVQLTHQEYTPSADGVFAEQLSEHTAWGYFVQLIDALDYLHSAGVVHGDIKPDNLLLGADGMVRLADFGSAMVLRKDGADTLTAIHGRTPAFLPPEACDGEEFSARSADVWAAGVTLYLMLFGRLPFGHPKLAPFAMYAAVSEGALSFPAEPRVSDACKDLLMAVLAKDAARRATIEDVVSHPWMTEILSDISSRRAVSCEAVGARAIEHWQSGLTTSYSGESSARTEHASLSRQSSSRLRRSASGLCAIHEMQVVREPSRAILRQPSSPVTSSPRAQAVKVVDENAGSGPYSLTASQSVHARMGPGSPLSTRSPQAMGEFKHIVQVLELEFPDVVPKLVLEEGDFLVGEGDASDKMYFIVHGEAEVIKQIASQSEGAEGGGLGDSHGSGCSARVDDENDGTEAARGSDKSSDDFAPMSGRGRVAAVSPTRNGFLPRQPYGKARGLGRYVSGKIDRHVLEEDLVRGSDQSYDSENPSTTHGSGLEAERASWTSRTSQSRASFLRRALGGASRRQDDSFVATQPGLVRRSRSSIDLKTDASRPEGARPDMTSLDRRRLSHWGAAAGGARGLQSATSSSLYNGRGVSFHGAPSRPAPSRFSRETDLGRSESQAGPALGGRAGQPGGESKGSVRGSWVFRSRKAHEDLEHLVRTAAESCDALGRAMRHEGGFRVLARISAGDVVGEIGLLGNSVRTASVRALTRLEVLEVSRSALATIAASAPLLQHDLKRVVAQRTATRRMMEAFEQLAGLHQRFSSEQGGRAAERPKLQAVPSLRALSRVLSRRAVLDEGAADAEEIAGDGSRTVAPAVSMSQMAVIPESREELQARAA